MMGTVMRYHSLTLKLPLAFIGVAFTVCVHLLPAHAEFQRPGREQPTSSPTPSPVPSATATATVTVAPRYGVTPTPTPGSTGNSGCWVSSGFDELGIYWNNKQINTVCIPVKTPGCVPGPENKKCHHFKDYEVGAGCGAIEGRISCENRPFFADPRNYRGVVTPNQAGLVDAN